MLCESMLKTDERKLQRLRDQRALNPEKHRAEVKDWKSRNRDKTLGQKDRAYAKNRGEILRKRREYRAKLNAMLDEVFGRKCALCGTTKPKKFHLHEIHGKKHPIGRQYLLENKEDFVRLCTRCHSMVTRMMLVFKLTWQDILHLKPGI